MNYKRLFISILLPLLAGGFGSLFTRTSVDTWYGTLEKPALAPPNWLFGPVWTLLYLLMGISVYLIWQKRNASLSWLPWRRERADVVSFAFVLFWIHLFFNAIWSIVFFNFHALGWALVNIAVIWLFIVAMMIVFWKVDRRATYLLIPYLLWVSFASALNYGIWMLN